MKTLRTLLLIAVCILPAWAAADELTPEKRQDILALLQSGLQAFGTNYDQLYVEAAAEYLEGRVVKSLHVEKAEQAPEAKRAVDKEVLAFSKEMMEGSGGPLDRMVRAYSERFSHDEIRQLLAFYQSPLGKRYVTETVKILSDASQSYADWPRLYGDALKERLSALAKKQNFSIEFR